MLESELLAGYLPEREIEPAEIAAAARATGRVLVVLDDDPTGTQSVSNLPVLTSWDVADFRWAFGLRLDGERALAVYVLTNTRSLDSADAAERNAQIVAAASQAAAEAGITLGFASRSDSTLRGHFPLETDTIAATLRDIDAQNAVDAVLMVPAFGDAGRLTVGGEHYMRTGGGELAKVSATEFAKDATFGFSTSYLPDYVAEKTGGRVAASDVLVLDLDTIRSGAQGIAGKLAQTKNAQVATADIVTENDMRALAEGLELAEAAGTRVLYRVGPPFVRARIGQDMRQPLSTEEIFAGNDAGMRTAGGLIVVGSHVGVTTRQLADLTAQHANATVIELEVPTILSEQSESYLAAKAAEIGTALATQDVIVHTSRTLVKTADAAESLEIARTVSAAVVSVVNRILHSTPPRFVIAKGGITSSDVAAHGLEIRHAIVRGPMLPGIVSLWESVDGPAAGIPYVVFAGNVGDDSSLTKVTRTLSTTF
ncbi:four-carbon acid sugar kinase family protein [Glutamicibacter sp. AOP12-B1-11]|uniref:four-carbon acid sugar kinase family protein n=1 Tax=Glutamicibacter sp. AOP12-B1-11 TaxID=3457725 RepID=UPI0040344CF5